MKKFDFATMRWKRPKFLYCVTLECVECGMILMSCVILAHTPREAEAKMEERLLTLGIIIDDSVQFGVEQI